MSYTIDCCNACPTVQTTNIPGLTGNDGAAGDNGLNGFSVVADPNTTPGTYGGNVTLIVDDTTWMVVGQCVVVEGPSHYTVTTVNGATSVTLTALNYPGDVALGSNILAGYNVSPAGFAGPLTTVAADLDPNGVHVGRVGQFYYSTGDSSLWIKEVGNLTLTNWGKLIGMILLLCSMLGLQAAAPPIVRNSYTTNYWTNASVLVTNAALVAMTNNYSYFSNAVVSIVTTNATVRNWDSNNVIFITTTNPYVLSVFSSSGSYALSTGVVEVATSASSNTLTAWNYSLVSGAVGTETNTAFVATNAGTYTISYGATVSGANTDVLRAMIYTNGVEFPQASCDFVASTTNVAAVMTKTISVALPANGRVTLRVSNSNAASTFVKDAFLWVRRLF